ncbi:MAG: hypothetical protein RL379_268 [Bacillota bacterium]|jgi:hypothetical protein
MKKEEFLTLIVYGVMIAIAIFVGVNIIAPAFVTLGINGISQYGYAIVTIFGAFIINVISLEVGHILGALAGGYAINTVNFLGLAFVRTKEGFKIRFQAYEGLTGETTVTPRAKKIRPRLFLWGGLIVYFIEILLCLVIAYGFFNELQWGRYASIIIIAVGGMLMIYNFMPFKLDTVTDGYRLATLTTTQGNAAYVELQRIEKAYKEGKDPQPFQVGKDLNNLTIQIYFHKIYQALVDEDYQTAEKDLKLVSTSPRLGETLQQKIFIIQTFIYFMKAKPTAAKTYYYKLDSKQRKYLSNDTNMITLSTYLYVAGMIEESFSEASYTFERQHISIKKIHESGRKAAESILFNRVLKLVKKKNSSWRFS